MRKRDYIWAFIFGVLIWAFFFYVVGARCQEKREKYEKDYQKLWCEQHGGKTEVRTKDGARVDCLTEEYAIEFDYAPKWAEAIGQALYYGAEFNRIPGVVLIVDKKKDSVFVKRFYKVQRSLRWQRIELWIIPK